MNATAQFQDLLHDASMLSELRTIRRDALRTSDDADHDVHEVKNRLRIWSNVQAAAPFLAVGVIVALIIFGLTLSSLLPAGAVHIGQQMLWSVLGPAAAGMSVFWFASQQVQHLRGEAMRARSAANLAAAQVKQVEAELAAADTAYWAKKRPKAA